MDAPAETASPVADAAPSNENLFQRLVRQYFGFIFKNVIGWLMIIASPILGIALPGPGGIPVFLIGFALVTFPGKRKITTHVFRGRRLPIETPLFTGLITLFSVLVTGGVMWAAWRYYDVIGQYVPLQEYGLGTVVKLVTVALLALPVTMVVTWVSLWILNRILLKWVPPIRRFLRRYLRKYGVRLLPTRRRRIGGDVQLVDDEIIGLDETQKRKLIRRVDRLKPWLVRLAGVSLTAAVIYFVVDPVITNWSAVETRLGELDVLRVALGVVAFAVGLWLFRTLSWQMVLRGFGEKLPVKSAARVWSLGHLARFIPGKSYRVLRMELARPYGISGPQANVSQKIEGRLALTAAIAVGAAAFAHAAWLRLPATLHPLWLAAGAVVLIGFIAVPVIFYRIAPAEIVRKPVGGGVRVRAGVRRLSRGRLAGVLAWQLVGTLWLAGAVWLLVGEPLAAGGVVGGTLAVAGAWSLGWAAGHLAKWSPGGIGVREVVFVGCLGVLLPPTLRDEMARIFDASTFLTTGFGDLIQISPSDLFQPAAWQDVWWAFLFFLAILLRLATTAAEFAYATVAVIADWSGIIAFIRGERGPGPRAGVEPAEPV